MVWQSWHDSPSRGYHDQSFLDWLFDQYERYSFAHHIGEFPDTDGIVLITPGHWRAAAPVNAELARYRWVLVIITSDEEADCPFWDLSHPRMSIWKHTPLGDLPFQPDRPLLLGWTPGTVEANRTRPEKTEDWVFAGQEGPEGNRRRSEAVAVMRAMTGGVLETTPGFLQGLDRKDYFALVRSARTVPCPSGPNIPDTFRLYEALESGAVPIADATCPRGDRGYWSRVFPTPAPFPVVDDWSTLPGVVKEYQGQFRRVQILAWWERTKREMVWRLHDDIAKLSGDTEPRSTADRITVIVPTSPIPSHPSAEIISETMASVRERLPNAEVLILCDGVRSELGHRRESYVEYLEELVWLCRGWRAVPLVFSEHTHQANMTRAALELVRDDLVLFIEHDTPLIGEIPLVRLGELVLGEYFHVIRFHHETAIPREHRYLMGSYDSSHPEYEGGPPLRFLRTTQWSQRPHLARTSRYRDWIAQIPVTRQTMIEDALYGQVASSDWDEYKIGIYHPDGSIQRSVHLDGRGSDSKFEATMG